MTTATTRYTVHRRTFGAAGYPAGSPERARLNGHALTSEYYRSKRWIVIDRDSPTNAQVGLFTLQRQAQTHAEQLEAQRSLGTQLERDAATGAGEAAAAAAAASCPNCGGPDGYSDRSGGHSVGFPHGPAGPDPIPLRPTAH